MSVSATQNSFFSKGCKLPLGSLHLDSCGVRVLPCDMTVVSGLDVLSLDLALSGSLRSLVVLELGLVTVSIFGGASEHLFKICACLWWRF